MDTSAGEAAFFSFPKAASPAEVSINSNNVPLVALTRPSLFDAEKISDIVPLANIGIILARVVAGIPFH